jgi:hypothetical protein
MRFLNLIARFAVVSSSKSSGNGLLEVLEYCNLFLGRIAPAQRVEVAQYAGNAVFRGSDRVGLASEAALYGWRPLRSLLNALPLLFFS